MEAEREVGGLRCSQVLEHLSDYVDGAASDETRRRIEEHLAGCDVCERFGGRFGEVVRALRKQLGAPEPVAADVAERVARHLEAKLGGD